MGLAKFFFNINDEDEALVKAAKIAVGLDGITTMSYILCGYNHVEYTGWDEDCHARAKELKKQGVKATVRFNGDMWEVLTKI